MRYIVMPLEGWLSERMADFEDGRSIREIARRARNEVTAAGIPGAPAAAGAEPFFKASIRGA